MCAAFDHAGHVYKQVKDAVGAHHSTIEQLAAEVVVSHNDAIAALDAIKIDRGELEATRMLPFKSLTKVSTACCEQ